MQPSLLYKSYIYGGPGFENITFVKILYFQFIGETDFGYLENVFQGFCGGSVPDFVC